MGLFGKKDKPAPPPGGFAPPPPRGVPPEAQQAFQQFQQQMPDLNQRQSIGDMMKMAQQGMAAMDAGAQSGAEVGSGTWVRAVMGVLRPAEPGFVKRCSCQVCGAPKQLPTTAAYVYCDFCGSLCDFDLRRACEGDTAPGPAYAQLVNSTFAQTQAAQAAGDQTTYRALQRQLFDAYVTHVPNAVSHRAKNDQQYREAYVAYMAECQTVTAFDPQLVALTEKMKQAVMSLKYTGGMLAMKVDPASFWPMVDVLSEQLAAGRAVYQAHGVLDLDPDHAGKLADKMGWSGFAQGWLGMLPDDAAAQLIERAGLTNEYVPVVPVDGLAERSCAGCGGKFHVLPGAKAIVCEQCGRTLDVGSAEIPCTGCGSTLTLPKGFDNVSCPYCKANVKKVGMY